jgi:hypothetical protein
LRTFDFTIQADAHDALRLTQASGLQNRENILAAKILVVLSASIMFTLGIVHLVYTFWGAKLTPRDPALQISSISCAQCFIRDRKP